MEKYDFSGWATRANLKCSDGRTIMKDAFKDDDGKTVPLVWNHQHNDPLNVLGHALLENRGEGVYAYCTFNDTESGQEAKKLVEHGDVTALSIYANKLKQQVGNVLHGEIREVSLVLAGANPGAFIDSVMSHGEESEEEATIYTGETIELYHAEETKKVEETKGENKPMAEEVKKPEVKGGEKTVQEVFDSLTEEQKTVVYAIIGQAIEDADAGEKESKGEENMKHNVFENETKDNTLIHNDSGEALTCADVEQIFTDGKRFGSLKESALQHGVTNIDYLFPEDKYVGEVPGLISRDMDWVSKFMGKVHHSPFSRVKSLFANITEDEARAKGYIKGNLKKEEVFSLLKRSTTPTTIYKKQKLDRDDVADITDFDVVAFLKSEMRVMLDEEIARAALVGDGRLASSDDKINEQNVRPIWTDADLYTIKYNVSYESNATADQKAKAFIKAAVKSRKEYKGSGNPILYTTEDMLTDCLLLEDTTGRVIYETVDKLKTALRVSDIVTVPVMEGLSRTNSDGTYNLMGIIVNPADYNIGADKGGAVNMFDDFDIDYNQMKYLIETRCSGALTKPYSAIALEHKA